MKPGGKGTIWHCCVRWLLSGLWLAAAGAQELAHGSASAMLLDDAPEALRVKLALIRSARSEIAVTVFLWRGDATGMEVAAALQDAARCGVRVRLLVDCLRMRFPAAMVDALCATPGVELRLFHPPSPLKPQSLNIRMHDKLLIVDREEVIIGGRNFSDFYYDRGGDWNYVDLDLRLNGSAAREAAAYFDRVWTGGSAVPWRSPPDPFLTGAARDAAWQSQQKARGIRRGQALLDAARSRNREALAPTVAVPLALSVPDGLVRFVSESMPRNPRESACLEAIEHMLAAAEKEVWLSTPWLVDTPRMHAAFEGCLRRGVKLHILTNGLGGCQDFVVFASHEQACAEWIRSGADVRCVPGPESLHTKAVVVDDRAGAVGTFNFDPRSERLNTESLIVIEHASFARDLRKVMLRQTVRALPFDADAWSQQGERNAPPGWKARRWITPLLQVLSPLFRSSL